MPALSLPLAHTHTHRQTARTRHFYLFLPLFRFFLFLFLRAKFTWQLRTMDEDAHMVINGMCYAPANQQRSEDLLLQ